MHARKQLPRAMVTAFVALLILAGGALAQSATGTISVTVLEPASPCAPVGDMTVGLDVDDTAIAVPRGESASNNLYYSNIVVSTSNASCDPWSITAQLTDFALADDSNTTFPGSTLVLQRMDPANMGTSTNPVPANPQPDWVQNLPSELETGLPTMPGTVTFTESGSGGSASSDEALLSASTAEYGSPGNYSANYWTTLAGVPTDLTPGSYTATMTVTIQGND